MTYLNSTRNDHRALKAKGFTLIEVMIVVAIVAILASIAYPSYMSQVQKSRRSDAVQALSQVQQAQERWRANNATYADAVGTLGMNATTSGGYYTLAINSNTATGYVATATPVAGTSQASDPGCGTGNPLTVSMSGGNITYTPSVCWGK